MKYRIREDVNCFVVERFCRGSKSPSGRMQTFDLWISEGSYKTLEEAKRRRELLINPVYH